MLLIPVILIIISVILTAQLTSKKFLKFVNGYLDARFWRDYNKQCANFQIFNERNGDRDIVFLGDSITEYYDTAEYFEQDIANRGISGDTTKGVLDRLEVSVLDINPKKVFILIGINDMGKNVPLAEILQNTRTIIERIQAECPETEIFVQSVYPVNNTDEEGIDKIMLGSRQNEPVIEYNKMLEPMCSELNVTYINTYPSLLDENGNLDMKYSIEGLHLNGEGYKLVTDILEDYLD